MNALQTMREIQTATLQARARKGDDAIATRVEAGCVQIVRVTYEGAESVIEPLSPYLPTPEVVAALNAL